MNWLNWMFIAVGVLIWLLTWEYMVMALKFIAALPFIILGIVFRFLMSTGLFG